MTLKNVASSMKAVNASYPSSGPWIEPVFCASTLQLVPNWNAITMPVTTPMPNDTANTFSQKSNTRRYSALPVASRAPSIVASHAANPIVNDGKMMWNAMTNANWRRDNKNASSSMTPQSSAEALSGPNTTISAGHDLRW